MFIAPKKPRSWGTRFSPLVPSTPSSQSTTLGDAFAPPSVDVADPQPPQPSATPADAEVEPRRAPYGHLPHDASVFVASLPSHLGVPELRQSLLEVFGSYKPVSHVKVIGPDERGAVCAFVQANNSDDASSLIDRFHMSFFHGRPIRCERARALRALFVSFKLPASPISEIGEHFPRSMRLHRQQNERYVRVLYNEDADSFDADDPVQNASYPSARDPLSCAGAYFPTMTFDMETLRTLCESFGPLEHFEPAVFPDVAPCPHDGPRDPSMYAQVLEVKWSHRNDSVSAFNLFDHLPFIAVSWAHSHPFHPDATPARPPISRFVPRFGGPYIKPAVPTPADVLPTTSEPATSENAAAPASSASPPQRITPRFVNATEINAASPFHGITERDFPPLSNRTPRNLDGVWSRPLRITVPSDALAAANEDEAAAQRDHDQDASSTDSRSRTPLLSPTADAPPTPSSPVPVTPLNAEFYQPQPDPTTLFVGGIAIARAPYWDEEQIRAFYARYGQIVDVTFVKPGKPFAPSLTRQVSLTPLIQRPNP
ncbi:hypothetical protein EXIGLDRAFT_359776 [Exidia glandulosa HHB12029]|uniref:RRM domain-containing protein n=1 Tax=Exidia glandulosa HHB12029 TaxID=1314781 RepID=A0A165ZEJ2_EXIGL|nr:hypothetical protein EXIGLDRAFT_359776 [Exidia glandulosa HHB12029]